MRHSHREPTSLHPPTIINPFMIATMNPLAWCFNVTRLGHRAEGSTMGNLATMAAPTTNTKRRTVHCSKHAFAPIASFHPKNGVVANVTLPVQRHQTCLRRAGLASESLVTGDDPLNATDPLGLMVTGPEGGDGTWSVYALTRNGIPHYVGRTSQRVTARVGQHANTDRYDAEEGKGYDFEVIAKGLDKTTARGLEEVGEQVLGTQAGKSDPQGNQIHASNPNNTSRYQSEVTAGVNELFNNEEAGAALDRLWDSIPEGSAQAQRSAEGVGSLSEVMRAAEAYYDPQAPNDPEGTGTSAEGAFCENSIGCG